MNAGKSVSSFSLDHVATGPQTISLQGINSTSRPNDLNPKKDHKTYLAPLPGHVWNPLRSLPRNSQCPCPSGKKFKACHLDKLPWAVPADTARQYIDQMAKPDLVFVTKENQAEVIRLAGEKA